MQGEFIIKIRATYNQMTKAEKKVADYILRDPRGMLFLSITELAEACSVGETSVFRFCKTMGAKGYQEFKMMLSLSLHEGADRLEQFTGSNLSLEDSFDAYKKGMDLLKICNDKIDQVEKKVLVLNGEGGLDEF